MNHGCQGEPESCEEEPFLHALSRIDGEGGWTYVVCTKHVSQLKIEPPIVIEGITQVHEVMSVCLVDGASWDVEENCCVIPEPEEDPALNAAQVLIATAGGKCP